MILALRWCSSPLALALVLLSVGSTGAPGPQTGASKGPSEKELLAVFQESFSDPDPTKRAAAVGTLGEGTRKLADGGAGKAVAKALVKALQDEELEVRDAAVQQLGFGRDVEVTIAGLDELLTGLLAALERGAKSQAPGEREFVTRGTVLFLNGCKTLANYRDDRSAARLAAFLAKLRADELGNALIGELAGTALDVGSLEIVTAAVKQIRTFHGSKEEPHLHPLFAALNEFAGRFGAPPPEWSAGYAAAWQSWLEANQGRFPKKLGRLKDPPTTLPLRVMDGLPGKSG